MVRLGVDVDSAASAVQSAPRCHRYVVPPEIRMCLTGLPVHLPCAAAR